MAAPTPKPKRSSWLYAWWGVVLAPVLGLFLMLVLAAFSDLPGTEDLENPRSDLATAILFSDGSQMGQYYRENRIPVDYERISPHVVNALIATEDERFREHSGIDVRGTLRAAVYLGKKGGASTLTQQLAKMLFTDRSPNFVKRTVPEVPGVDHQRSTGAPVHEERDHRHVPQPLRLDQSGGGYQQRGPRVLQHHSRFPAHRGGRPAGGHVQEPCALQPAA
jgi:hypothetical protein